MTENAAQLTTTSPRFGARWKADPRTQRELLLRVLREPQSMGPLTLKEWDRLLPLARLAGVLSRLAVEAHDRGLVEIAPEEVRPHLVSAKRLADRHWRVVHWELNRIGHALRELPDPLALLKGAAYLALDLPIARGRIYGDIDLLTPEAQIAEVESSLRSQGWRTALMDERDERYFRTWLHELPPLKHRRRRTFLDVHHTILPRTDRLRVSPQALLANSQPTSHGKLRVLAPADMFLHAAAHLYRNGDFTSALRDLYDLNGLARHFGTGPEFWEQVVQGAESHDLTLPCYFAIRHAARYYHLPLDERVTAALVRWKPHWPLTPIVDRLVDRALTPRDVQRPDDLRQLAINVLAHWPVPRWSAMFSGIFWTKRLPRRGETHALRPKRPVIQPGGEKEPVEEE